MKNKTEKEIDSNTVFEMDFHIDMDLFGDFKSWWSRVKRTVIKFKI